MNKIDWTTWIPDGTTLHYCLKGTTNWEINTVIDDRIYKKNKNDEAYHLVAFPDCKFISFSITCDNTNGKQGTHDVKL
tara:strand:+ start:215 stop:448 length:234 start_codon:yes stop_codon:yes gene_type:complete